MPVPFRRTVWGWVVGMGWDLAILRPPVKRILRGFSTAARKTETGEEFQRLGREVGSEGHGVLFVVARIWACVSN